MAGLLAAGARGRSYRKRCGGRAGLEQVASSDAIKKVDVEWPRYLAAARAEAADAPSAESALAVFYHANCLSLPKPWAR
jgi:hypothetical protein